MNTNGSDRKITVRSRSYGSWLLYMGILLLGLYYNRNYWYLFVLVMIGLSAIFFGRKDQVIMQIENGTISFLPQSDKMLKISQDQLVSFSYGNGENSLNIIYRNDQGSEETYQLVETNLIRIHQVLNNCYPEKNKLRNEYNEKVEESRKANRQYFSNLRNRIKGLFK